MMAAVSGILFFLVLLATNLRAALAVPTDKV
jgi:hypothetical protein